MSAIRTHPEITPQRPHCVAGVGGFESHTPCNRCVRFATTVASGHATLATKRTLLLTWAGLSPAGSHQLAAGALIQSPRRSLPMMGSLSRPQEHPAHRPLFHPTGSATSGGIREGVMGVLGALAGLIPRLRCNADRESVVVSTYITRLNSRFRSSIRSTIWRCSVSIGSNQTVSKWNKWYWSAGSNLGSFGVYRAAPGTESIHSNSLPPGRSTRRISAKDRSRDMQWSNEVAEMIVAKDSSRHGRYSEIPRTKSKSGVSKGASGSSPEISSGGYDIK